MKVRYCYVVKKTQKIVMEAFKVFKGPMYIPIVGLNLYGTVFWYFMVFALILFGASGVYAKRFLF